MTNDAIALLDSLYDNGDLSIDQHAGIMAGLTSAHNEVLDLIAGRIKREADERVITREWILAIIDLHRIS